MKTKKEYTTWQLFKIVIKRTHFLEWFDKYFWEYLLDDDNRFTDKTYCSRLHRILCRATGHVEGVWYFNSGGSEPDMTCKGCGDDIG